MTIAVTLACTDDGARAFDRHSDFAELPTDPHRLFLTAAQPDAMVTDGPEPRPPGTRTPS